MYGLATNLWGIFAVEKQLFVYKNKGSNIEVDPNIVLKNLRQRILPSEMPP